VAKPQPLILNEPGLKEPSEALMFALLQGLGLSSGLAQGGIKAGYSKALQDGLSLQVLTEAINTHMRLINFKPGNPLHLTQLFKSIASDDMRAEAVFYALSLINGNLLKMADSIGHLAEYLESVSPAVKTKADQVRAELARLQEASAQEYQETNNNQTANDSQ
jgi:hypothetical protein